MSETPRRTRRVRSDDFEIADAPALGHLVKAALVARGGTLMQAAMDLGIPKSTLSDLTKGKQTAIRDATLRILLQLIPKEQHASVRRTLLSAVDRALLAAYHRRIFDEFRSLRLGAATDADAAYCLWQSDGVRMLANGGVEEMMALIRANAPLLTAPYPPELVDAITREGWTEAQARRVIPLWRAWGWHAIDGWHLMQRIRGTPTLRASVERFEVRLERAGHLPPNMRGLFLDCWDSPAERERLRDLLLDDALAGVVPLRYLRPMVAWLRVHAPLLEARQCGSVERLWEEFSDAELATFIRAGIRREELLLARAPDLQRARELGDAHPLDLRAAVPLWDATQLDLAAAEHA